jgi:hypothetical protein
MSESIALSLIGPDGQDIEGLNIYNVQAVPRAGETIHYWQDGTVEDVCADSGIRRDFLVNRVEHDFRYLPPRGGSSRCYQTAVLHVTELTPKTLT